MLIQLVLNHPALEADCNKILLKSILNNVDLDCESNDDDRD